MRGLFFARDEGVDVRRLVGQVGRRQKRMGWMRKMPGPDLERLVARIEMDLADNPTRDSLLEHLARLHFDTTARRRARDGEVLIGDTDSARCAVESVVFERRYGVSMLDALGPPDSIEDEWERANLYVEGAFRRLDVSYTYLGPGRWLLESATLAVYLHHYPAARILDIYAPLIPVPADEREEIFAELLESNGGSIAGAFYGICSFGDSGEHICACARVATEELTGPDLVYALNSVLALGERFRDEALD